MSAVLSACGTYRYRLTRVWATGEKGALLWVMLNPSTADATLDDATIRRCRKYSQNWGYGGLMVGNVWAYRSTSPAEMFSARSRGVDIVGPENMTHLAEMAQASAGVICAWGNNVNGYSDRVQVVCRILKQFHPQLLCLQKTQDGHPHHPLRLPADLKPIPYNPYLPKGDA